MFGKLFGRSLMLIRISSVNQTVHHEAISCKHAFWREFLKKKIKKWFHICSIPVDFVKMKGKGLPFYDCAYSVCSRKICRIWVFFIGFSIMFSAIFMKIQFLLQISWNVRTNLLKFEKPSDTILEATFNAFLEKTLTNCWDSLLELSQELQYCPDCRTWARSFWDVLNGVLEIYCLSNIGCFCRGSKQIFYTVSKRDLWVCLARIFVD